MDVKISKNHWIRNMISGILVVLAVSSVSMAQNSYYYPSSSGISNMNQIVTNTLFIQNSQTDINLTTTVNGTNVFDPETGTTPIVAFGGLAEAQTARLAGSANVVFYGNTTFNKQMDSSESSFVNAQFGGPNGMDSDIPGGNATVVFATGSTTRFWGEALFGSPDNANANNTPSGWANVTFQTGSVVTFENQNTYFGGGGYYDFEIYPNVYEGSNNGGDATLNFNGGIITFQQRACIGGGASTLQDDSGNAIMRTTGHSTLVFNDGTNTFNWINAYFHHEDDYYGLFVSALSGKDGIAESGGTDITINGGTNNFLSETHIGGGYDLTPYGNINTSSDDFDVVWGGKNNFTINQGTNIFAARTMFGAANSTTNFTINNGINEFTGDVVSYHMSIGDTRATSNDSSTTVTGATNNYYGQDLPYVFFGGKTLNNDGNANNDISYWNQYIVAGNNISAFTINGNEINFDQKAYSVTTISGGKTTVGTTAFFGGVDYNYLGGSADAKTATFSTTEALDTTAFTDDAARFQAKNTGGNVYTYTYNGQTYTYNMILNNSGQGVLNLTGGQLILDVSNTTQVVEYFSQESDVTTKNPVFTTNRNSQVQLIGAADNSAFNATSGELRFTVADNGVDVYNYSGALVDQLNAARLVFDNVNIGMNAKIQVANVGAIMERNNVGKLVSSEYFTVETFNDTKTVDEMGAGQQMQIGQIIDGTYRYEKDYMLYNVAVEDLARTNGLLDVDGTPDMDFTSRARLHLRAKSEEEVFETVGGIDESGGNLGNNFDEFIDNLVDAENDPECPDDIKDSLENIANSDTIQEGQANFDEYAGGSWGTYVHSQLRRLTMFNSLLNSRVVGSDMALDALCPRCANCNNTCDSYGNCSACCGPFGFRNNRYCQATTSFWGSFFGDDGSSDYYKGYTAADFKSTGMAVGYEYRKFDCSRWGAYFSYTDSKQDTFAELGGTRIDSDDYMVGLYGKWDALVARGYTMINTNVTYNDYSSDRYWNTNPAKLDTFESGTHGVQFSANLERGWMFVLSRGFVLNPFMGVQYSYMNINDFDEAGTSDYLNLHVSELDYSSLRTNVGARISRDFIFGYNEFQILRLSANASWVHECLNKTVDYDTNLVYAGTTAMPTPIWDMRGNSTGNNWVNVGVGVDYQLTRCLSVSGNYNVFFNEYTTVNAGMGTFKLTW